MKWGNAAAATVGGRRKNAPTSRIITDWRRKSKEKERAKRRGDEFSSKNLKTGRFNRRNCRERSSGREEKNFFEKNREKGGGKICNRDAFWI